LRAACAREGAQGMNKAALVVRKGGVPGTRYEIAANPTLIGRNPSTHVTLVDEGISREHAVISQDDGVYTIEDLQSTNGTKVNGKRVRFARLSDGDEIQIGRTLFTFRAG
jgi:pSer/pThr/pTyr-binding forkhead associated (FHA) protein